MHQFLLCPHIHVCATEDGAVILDLKHEQYFGLTAEQYDQLRACVGTNTATVGDQPARNDHCADEFLNAGVITEDAQCGKALRMIESRASQAISFEEVIGSQTPVRLAEIANLSIAWAVATTLFKRFSLAATVSRVHARSDKNRTSAARAVSKAHRLAVTYQRIRPIFLTAQGKCVLDSLVLIEFLARYEVFPSWVFGVQTQPFWAHSWVQYGELVLNDTVENVRAFRPIMAV